VSLRSSWLPLAVVGVAGLAEVLLWRLFPDGGRYPFHTGDILAGSVFCLLGLALTWRVERARVLRFFFAVYFVAMIGAYLVPSQLGGNIDRLRFMAIPLAALVLGLRHWRPLPVAVGAMLLALSWNVSPLAANYLQDRSDVTARPATWPAAISYLEKHAVPQYRVEAVDTVGHWPAFYLADANIPLARGWFRQDDFPENSVLYSKLGPGVYLRWLHSLGVGYIVLSKAPPDYSSVAEAKLVRKGHFGLEPVFHTAKLTIYKVPDARPIVTGPAGAAIVRMTDAKIKLVLKQGGTYRIAVRWSPYWRTSHGCLTQGKDGMLRLTALHSGFVRLSFVVSADSAFDTLTGTPQDCAISRN
jgi:hypothetical protein